MINKTIIENHKENGITLIALVITIIILLILAGISIATLTGENGILNKADIAKTKTEKSTAEEQVKLAVMASYDKNGKLDIKELKKELGKIQGEATITDNDGEFPVTVIVDNYTFEIDDKGNTTLINENTNKPILPEKKSEELIETMISNTSITGQCYFRDGASNAYNAFDKDASSYATSPSTNQTEDYIEYDFNDAVTIQKMDINFIMGEHVFSNCKVTASLDGTSWDTIIETNDFDSNTLNYTWNIKEEYKNKQYKQVRIWQLGTRLGGGDNRMCVAEIQMYGLGKKVWNKLIEPMTQNTSAIGSCSYIDGKEGPNSAYNAFDGNTGTYTNSPLTGQQEDYIEYDFNNAMIIQKIGIQFAMGAHVFSNCKVTASLDGTNWDTIIETNEFDSSKLRYILDVKEEYKNKQYKNIRIWQLGTRLGGGDNRMCVAEIQMYNSK